MALYEIIPTNWGSLFPKAKQVIIENSPKILAGVGVASLLTAGIIAAKNTPAAIEAVEEKREEEGVRKLPLWDIIKVGFRYYVVPAGMAIAGSVCVFKAISVSESRSDAFAALAASEAMRLKDYREGVREKIGDKKEKEIEAEVAQKEVDRDMPKDIRSIEETGHGEQIVYWPMLGRWFKCDIGWIRRVVNEVNKEIAEGDVNENDPYDTKTLSGVSLNRFLGGLNLYKCDIGMLVGWNGKNRLNPRFYDSITGKESEKAVVLVMHMDDCMPTTKWDSVRQDKPVYIAPF